ncbi:MAG: type II toxin-antitoxin system Phd/YefM family antitoxin [Planctomycetes bacterium]|nr:type II toxin-antitoxin system Phd/YefM family antitoxin [Planctomycetota bacterium]
MATLEQLDSFHQFAAEQLDNGGADLTIDELFSRWRMDNPTPSERDEVNAIIRRGLEDIAAGRSRDADEVTEELRVKHGIPSE